MTAPLALDPTALARLAASVRVTSDTLHDLSGGTRTGPPSGPPALGAAAASFAGFQHWWSREAALAAAASAELADGLSRCVASYRDADDAAAHRLGAR